ncbi:Non-hem dioxygenase N-terminal domain - like 10 [Theobroma cacao]|nr:Non-hem dioxygenase N-terminal domain - like 10 [Theobroma cacao]
MEITIIDLDELHGEKRSKTMALQNKACEKWGFFQVNCQYLQVDNHGIDKKLMEKVKDTKKVRLIWIGKALFSFDVAPHPKSMKFQTYQRNSGELI